TWAPLAPDPGAAKAQKSAAAWPRALLLILLLLLSWICAKQYSVGPTPDELRFGGSREAAALRHAAGAGGNEFFTHARAIAACGDRTTDSPGCEAALAYVLRSLKSDGGFQPLLPGFAPEHPAFEVVRRDDVLLQVDHHDPGPNGLRSSLAIDGDTAEIPLDALRANAMNACATPPEGLHGTLVWLGDGKREHWPRADLTGCIAVLDFNSEDAWLNAAAAGAVGCVFLEPAPPGSPASTESPAPGPAAPGSASPARPELPATSYVQADRKYLALLPLNVPRLYAAGPAAAQVRLAADDHRGATLRCGLRLESAKAPYLEAVIPGSGKYQREILVVGYLDSRSVVPGRAPGGSELWSAAGWLTLANYFAHHPCDFDLRFLLFTGHWQSFALERAWAERHQAEFGPKIALTMGLDFSPDSRDFGVQAMRGFPNYAGNRELNQLLLRQGKQVPVCDQPAGDLPPVASNAGFLQQLEAALAAHPKRLWQPGSAAFHIDCGPPKGTTDMQEDDRYPRPDLTQTPRFPDAADPFRALGVATLNLGCSEPERPLEDTPLDHFDAAAFAPAAVAADDAAPAVKNLRTQFFCATALLGAIARQAKNALPAWPTVIRDDYAGRVVLHLRLVQWDAPRLWYRSGIPQGPGLHTYVLVVPTSGGFSQSYPGAVFPRVTSPNRDWNRGLQSFSWSFLEEVPQQNDGALNVPLVYAAVPDNQVTVLAFTLDEQGHVRFATDLGRHGDQAFPILNVDIRRPELNLQLKLFPCGTLTLFDLADPERKQFSNFVEGQNTMQWGQGEVDAGEGELLPVHAVQLAGSHTEPEEYSYLQWRRTAMVFMPPDRPTEVLVGSRSTRMAIFNHADADHPEGPGYTLAPGAETRVLHTLQAAIDQSHALTAHRLARYRSLGVASPAADAAVVRSRADLKAAAAAPNPALRWADEQLAWKSQDVVYRESYQLLVDVVSTTIFYFLVLLPFSYLIERLLFPQITLTRSAAVSAAIFAVFAALLYLFHPGFRLADNIVVALISFLVVVLTLPALFLTMGRGLSLIRDWGRRERRQHSAGADATGVVLAALSLAVSNMRRRKLRTGLTLTTLTLLVLSLVVLTTTSAEIRYRRTPAPGGYLGAYRGVEIFNQEDHLNGLHDDLVKLLRDKFGADCDVGVRRYIDPGYETRVPIASATDRTQVPSVMLVSPDDATLFPSLNRNADAGGVLTAGRWIRPGDVAAVVLPGALAAKLHARVGDVVHVYRFPLTVVGILDDTRFEQRLDVDAKPLTTYSFHTEQTNHRDPEYNHPQDCVYVALNLWQTYGWLYGPARAMVFHPHPPTPAEIAAAVADLQGHWAVERAQPERLRFPDQCEAARAQLNRLLAQSGSAAPPAPPAAADLHAIAEFDLTARRLRDLADRLAGLNLGLDVYFDDPAPPWALAPDDLRRRAAGNPTAGDRVIEMAASADVSMREGAMMIFPLLIAFFMILSIMIGSVYERRQEIYVFSAVGLAPRHVAIMFLAEAVVYAGIAAVLGYFLGIILLGSLRTLGALPANFYPNYLGVFVIYAALLAFAATLLSALYPIYLAGRMVNPSLERTWAIDEKPVGRDWLISLPFIASDRREACGILCFLRHFLELHVGSRSGGFALPDEPPAPQLDAAATAGGSRAGAGASASASASLTADIWLAPFERNILQQARIEAAHDPARNLYLLRLRLHLNSGQQALWQRSAHVFVDALRKQLLVWRGLLPGDLNRLLLEGDLLIPAADRPATAPSAPANPAEPFDPAAPAARAARADPADPAEPADPTDPTDPTDPPDPTDRGAAPDAPAP
ncbi:MAG: FtsX-like permease family protein, partial [Planctomycetota bacterium]